MKNISLKTFLLGSLAVTLVGPLAVTVQSASENSSVSNNGTITFSGEYDWERVDPENPGKIVNPGESETAGKSLRIDYVPTLDFNQQVISSEDQLYPAKAQLFHDETPARANYVQVSDFRGTGKGWTLQLSQDYQFRNPDDKNIILNGAVISLNHSWANSANQETGKPEVQKDVIEMMPGTTYDLATAKPGAGEGTWLISFGASETNNQSMNSSLEQLLVDKKPVTDPVYKQDVYVNHSVSLLVPGKTEKKAVPYQTVLTWTLSELP
ncbi:hypothetical protein IGI37_003270 [Enterococcus sp. AZ194]|uniref:WxL domain-containing protein n=1 Tax=Enterococcus sp. AZ194 TaxID=2774629 RepID=UPI003F208940